MNNSVRCHCGRNRPFNDCCEPIINGKLSAKTAEDLMRSRYTAYRLIDIDYIMESNHPSTRQPEEWLEIKQWATRVNWKKLQVIATKDGKEQDVSGYVTFKAFFKEAGRKDVIYEQSFFKKEKGRWYYVSGKRP